MSDECDKIQKQYDSLLNANQSALSGTSLINVWELRMAFDYLRERLYVKHNDSVSQREVATEVTRRIYKIHDSAESEQLSLWGGNDND